MGFHISGEKADINIIPFIEDLFPYTKCFVCLEKIEPTDNWVHWSGMWNIFMHPHCAKALGCALITDAKMCVGSYERGHNLG